MSAKRSIAKMIESQDVEVPPIIWPLMKQILQQLEKGGEITIVFDSPDQPSAQEIKVLSKQLRDLGIKLAVNQAPNKLSRD